MTKKVSKKAVKKVSKKKAVKKVAKKKASKKTAKKSVRKTKRPDLNTVREINVSGTAEIITTTDAALLPGATDSIQ